MIISYIKYIVILVLLIFIQDQLIWLLSITKYQITPDIVIIMIAYIAAKEGQMFGTITGFVAGMLLDILGGSFLGLSALSYSVAGFAGGYFFNPDNDKYLIKYNFLWVVFVCAFTSNFIYYNIFLQGALLSFFDILLKYILPSTTYTIIISLVYAVIPRRGEMKKVY
ncbi:MAG: rod shape-determining protein MreD [Ignavibacteriae bacterium]|nr:rod shape-determining protein MreD [Ignavibacteriota bacterium]MCB9243005.1 rod shape-determining protein MreD [Ignavibacteriales bacterium]